MVFGSYWTGIKLIQLDPKTGKRIAPDSKMISLAYNESIEGGLLFVSAGRLLLSVRELGFVLPWSEQHLQHPHRAKQEHPVPAGQGRAWTRC